jgi:hypothetical protein
MYFIFFELYSNFHAF